MKSLLPLPQEIDERSSFDYETLSPYQMWCLERYGDVPAETEEDEDDWGFWNDDDENLKP